MIVLGVKIFTLQTGLSGFRPPEGFFFNQQIIKLFLQSRLNQARLRIGWKSKYHQCWPKWI
jgi:hypothetical protein